MNDISRFSDDALRQYPERMVELTTTRKFSFTRQVLEDLQLDALRMRFASLVDHVPLLGRFAEEQGLKDITRLEDAALLLFPHTMYKSYPLSAIENSQFNRLTRWVGTLTALDVSGVNSDQCGSIDDWIDAMDASSEVRLRHSSGTTGKLSFIPGSDAEAYTSVMGMNRYFQGFGDEPDADCRGFEGGDKPVIAFGYRKGAMAFSRSLDAIQRVFYRDEPDWIHATNPGRFSADMLSLGGRLEAAQARGAVGKAALSPALLARRELFMREQSEAPERLEQFFDTIATRFRGRRVILNGVTPPVVEAAVAGLARGLEKLFAPDSLMFLAGGNKGHKMPDNYPALVERFTGVKYPQTGYGMSEAASGITRMCPAGHYHIIPNLIPFLIHPQTGELLARSGAVQGRFGFFDIAAQTRWGGFLTGDEITINFGDDKACGCGRMGAFIDGGIRRYTEAEGGDDKITCAGAANVHDAALDFIRGAVE
jgi:hypothetical protein